MVLLKIFRLIDKTMRFCFDFSKKKHIFSEGGHRILFLFIHDFYFNSYVGGVIPNEHTDYRRRIMCTHSRTILTIIRSSVGVAL